eukprot:scaffold5297_cov374-Prasinococcus_capsulatus_cf.AAC.16
MVMLMRRSRITAGRLALVGCSSRRCRRADGPPAPRLRAVLERRVALCVRTRPAAAAAALAASPPRGG